MNPLTNNTTHVRAQQKAADLPSGEWAACEEVIRRFEAAWHAGDSPPVLREYVPEGVTWRGVALQELVQIDLELRRKRGEPVEIDSYFQQFPELRSDADFVSHLAIASAEPLSTAALDLPGFEIVRELGRGGMGVVYLARQTALKRLVAIKMLRGRYGSDGIELARFRTEVEAAARLKHPQIVQLYEVGEHSGEPYCVLEYVAGGSLLDMLQGTPQPKDDAARLVQQLAQAVQHAHERGVIHRDLKPANILLESAGNELAIDTVEAKGRDASTQRDGQPRASDGVPPTAWRPKIADFGLARELTANETEKTQTGMIVGTPAYMSPEQAEGHSKQCGPATDIYALGVLLYELLTGRPPHQGATVLDTLEQIRSQDPVAPRALQPQTPRDLNTICLKCLRKDPARRYAAAQALADDLAAYLERRPISARPVGSVERAWMAARRRPLVASLALAVCVIAAIGLAAGVFQWRQTNAALSATAVALKNEQTERAAKEVALSREQTEKVGKESALRRAEEALADTKAFSRFVVDDILAAARPEGLDGGLGIDVTVRKALDTAAGKLSERFAGQPRAEAIARFDLAATYEALSDFENAALHFQEAVRLNREQLGTDDPLTIESENRLGSVLLRQGQMAEAIAIHEALHERCQRLNKADSNAALSVMHSLVADYRAAGREDEALELSERRLRKSREMLGADDPSLMKAIQQHALILAGRDRTEEALPLLREAYAWWAEHMGQENPATLNASMTLIFGVYNKQGRPEEALSMLERNLELMTAKFGPEHIKTLACMSTLALSYGRAGQFDRAIELDEQALSVARRNLGSTHPQTLIFCRELAKNYELAGRDTNALPLFEEAYRQRANVLGRDHRDTLVSQEDLANAYRAAGREADATALAEEALAGLRAKLGDEHPKTISAMNSLAVIYKRSGRAAEALPLYQQVAETCTNLNGPDHLHTLLARSNVAGAQLALKRVDDAIAILEETLTRSEKSLGPSHRYTLSFVQNTALAYRIVKRNDEAFPLLRRAYEGYAAAIGPNHPDTLSAQFNYASILLARRDTDEAERLLRDCQARLAASKDASATLKKQVAAALEMITKQSSGSAKIGDEPHRSPQKSDSASP